MEQKFSTVINEKSQFNGYFISDFDDFLQIDSSTYKNVMNKFDL